MKTLISLIILLLLSSAALSLVYVYPENNRLDSRGDGTSPDLGQRNQIFQDAYEAYLSVRNAVKSGDYELGRSVLDDLWASYPRGDKIWRTIDVNVRDNSFDATDFGRKPFYVVLIFYDDLINWRLQNQILNRKSNAYINLVIVVSTENHLTVTAEGEESQTYISKLDPKIRENDYRAIKEAFSDFDEIVFYLTEGRYNLKLIIVEHDTPTTSSVTYTRGIRNTRNSRPIEKKTLINKYGEMYSADWGFLMYPFNNDFYYALTDTIGRVVTGGMGGYEGRPFLMGTIEKILYSRAAHHPLMSSDERIAWITSWLIHEHMHRIYALYRHLKLEEVAHSYYKRDTWPADFEGSFHQDYYTESIKKRILLPQEVRMYEKLKRDLK